MGRYPAGVLATDTRSSFVMPTGETLESFRMSLGWDIWEARKSRWNSLIGGNRPMGVDASLE